MTDLLEKYFSDKSNTSNRSDYKELNVFFNTFFESSSTHDLNLFTTQEFIDTLSKMNILSCVTFETYKSRIKSFFEWCFKNEYCTKTQIDNLNAVTFDKIKSRYEIYATSYFADFDDLFESLQSAFDSKGTEFDTFRSAAILVWYGFEIESVIEILKKDVIEQEFAIIHPFKKNRVFLSELAINFITKYRDADDFDSSKFGGTIMKYQKSEYLFRTYKNAHMDSNQIIHSINPANKIAKKIGRRFNWKLISLSGIYYRLFQYEQEHGNISRTDFEVLRKFFQKDGIELRKRNLSMKYDDYESYKITRLV